MRSKTVQPENSPHHTPANSTKLSDLFVGTAAAKTKLEPDQYVQVVCEAVTLRRALLAAHPDVRPPKDDTWRDVPPIVKARADAGKGVSPAYPDYPPQPWKLKELPYIPMGITEARNEIEQIRENLLNEDGRVARYERLTQLVEILTSNVVNAMHRDDECFPSIETFLERKADLVRSVAAEFLEVIEPSIQTLGRHVFELHQQRFSPHDIAKRYGVEESDPRFPDYLREPATLEEATSVIRDFFSFDDPSSPFHRAAVGALMLLEQVPLIVQRYRHHDTDESLFGAGKYDELEHSAQAKIFEAPGDPYKVVHSSMLDEFIRWFRWWDEGIDSPDIRDLVQKMFSIFIHSTPISKRYGSAVVKETYGSSWGHRDPQDLFGESPFPIPTSPELASEGSEFHIELKRKLLPKMWPTSDILFRDREFQSMAVLDARDYMGSLRAIELFYEINSIAEYYRYPIELSVTDLTYISRLSITTLFEHRLTQQRARYTRPVSAADVAHHFTFEHLLSKAHANAFEALYCPTKEIPTDLAALELVVRHLVSTGQTRTPSIDLTTALMRIVYDSWYPERYGGKEIPTLNYEPGDKGHEPLARSLHIYGGLRLGLPDASPSEGSFTEPAPDAPVNFQRVSHLAYWLHFNLPGVLKRDGHAVWSLDGSPHSYSELLANLIEGLKMRMGAPSEASPISVADLALTFQMTKYINTIASESQKGGVIAKQPLLPEQRGEIIARIIDNPSPQQCVNSANLRAVARGLECGVPQPEVFEEIKRLAPIDRLTDAGIAVYMMERDLAIQPAGLDHLRIEPGLLQWDDNLSHARASDNTPHGSFFNSLDSLGDFDLWAPFVSVKEAFKLERAFAQASRPGLSVPLLREFLHASRRLKTSFAGDSRVEELLSLSPEMIAERFSGLVRQKQHAIATAPSRVAIDKPLDAVLLSEALRRDRASSRLATIDILELHQYSIARGKVAPLPHYATAGSTSLPIRRKQRESLRGESTFLKLFEFCDHVATDFTYHPDKESSAVITQKNSLGAALLKTLETRHFSIKKHKIDSDTFLAGRDNIIYASHVLEALLDAVDGASGDTTWASHPEIKPQIWEQLNFDGLLKELDSAFVEYQALPETKNQRIIEFAPTRGALMEFAGDICGTCVSRINFISENASEGFFIPFIRGGKSRDSGDSMKRLEGGAFIFQGTLADGRQTLVIRGFNPSHGLINEVSIGELFERFTDYISTLAIQAGIPTVSIPDESTWGSTMTNRRYAFLYLRGRYGNAPSIELSPSQVSTFNNHSFSNVKIVREVALTPELSPSASPETTRNSDRA